MDTTMEMRPPGERRAGDDDLVQRLEKLNEKQKDGWARKIARERLPWATPLGRLLEGAIAGRRGERERALHLLATATDELEACQMRLWAAAARLRRGEILGGEEGKRLVEAALACLRDQLVKDPAAYCAMLAPGYARARGA